MDWSPTTTRLLIAFLFVAGVILDVWLASVHGNDCTLSKQVQWISLNWPIVIVAYGGLAAHFFVPKYEEWPGLWAYAKPILCLLTGFIAFSVAWRQQL